MLRSCLQDEADALQAFLIPSWLSLIGFTTCIIWAVEADIITRHIWDVPPMKLASDGLVSRL